MTSVAPAASIVLTRPRSRTRGGADPAELTAAPAAPEVFFVRRHASSAFMANAWVFPGGRRDVLDRDVRALERVRGLDVAALLSRMHGVDDPDEALGLAICAIRETFEEAGVLLGVTRGGAALDALTVAALSEAREDLIAGVRSFPALLEELDLWLDGGALVYFDHWITPPVERRRFDTRFFVARAPERQSAAHDAVEVTDSCWATAGDALARHATATSFALSPPTFWIVGDLAHLADVDEIERWAACREVAPVRPTVVAVDGRLCIALPGDPLHPVSDAASAAPRRILWTGAAWVRG